MRTSTLTGAVFLMVGLIAHADEGVRRSQIEQLRATADYYVRAGKPKSAEYQRQVADKLIQAEGATTIYVPLIRSERLSRDEAARVTESIIRGIEREARLKVVGSPEEADLILEAIPKPMSRHKP